MDGCYWRAERMRQILDSVRRLSKKIFVHGDFNQSSAPCMIRWAMARWNDWMWHRSWMVSIRRAKSVQWVMDPSMSPNTIDPE